MNDVSQLGSTLIQVMISGRRTVYLERFEFFCKECKLKGTVVDVFLNPEMLVIRGFCDECQTHGVYKVVDIVELRKEYESMKLPPPGDDYVM